MKYNITIRITGNDWTECIEAADDGCAEVIANDEFKAKSYGPLQNVTIYVDEVSYNRDFGEYSACAEITGEVMIEIERPDDNVKAAIKQAYAEAAQMDFGDLDIDSLAWKSTCYSTVN